MSNIKSIRKCDDKVTAKDLGVKEGDKFVVLPPEESYKKQEHCRTFSAGMVVELVRDDQTCCPQFKIAGTSGEAEHQWAFEYFSCLARYEDYYKQEEKEAVVALENVKFDMKAIANELNVSLEAAHNIVQNALFAEGVEWASGGDDVQYTTTNYLTVEEGRLKFASSNIPQFKQLSIKIQHTFYVKEQPKELVEINGKRYNKEDLEKALALLSPVSE